MYNVSSTVSESLCIILQANEAAKLRVDVVNFSYGEACHWVDKGSVYLCLCVCVALCTLVVKVITDLVLCMKHEHPIKSSTHLTFGNSVGLPCVRVLELTLACHRHLVYI